MGEMRNVYKIMVGKSKWRRPLRRTRRRWEGNIKINLKEIGKVWIGFIWLRIESVPGSCKHSNEPSGSTQAGNVLTS
jgi:hypothetical protein